MVFWQIAVPDSKSGKRPKWTFTREQSFKNPNCGILKTKPKDQNGLLKFTTTQISKEKRKPRQPYLTGFSVKEGENRK